MNYRHLSLHCECGQVPDRIAEVGFTDDHNLIVHWWCSQCKKVVYLAKPLTDCWRECPSADYNLEGVLSTLLADKPEESHEEADAKFLRSIGVQV